MKPLSASSSAGCSSGTVWSLLRRRSSHHFYGKAGQRVGISVPVHGNMSLSRGLQYRLMVLAGIPEGEDEDCAEAHAEEWVPVGLRLGAVRRPRRTGAVGERQ